MNNYEYEKKLNEIEQIEDDEKAIIELDNLLKELHNNKTQSLPIYIELFGRYNSKNDYEKNIDCGNKIIEKLNNTDLGIAKGELLYILNSTKMIMANSYKNISNLQKAVDIYGEIINTYENNSNISNNLPLIIALQELGRIQAAVSEKKIDIKEKNELLEMAKDNLEKALDIDDQDYVTYTHLALVYNNLGNIEQAENYYEKSITILMDQKLQKYNFNKMFYKYIKLDKYTIVDLINENLFFNDPKQFNDPFDCPIYRGDNYRNHKSLSNVLDKIRVTCFSSYENSILMWSHYADSHKGICIGYIIDDKYCKENNVIFEKVKYKKHEFINKNPEEYEGLLEDSFLIKNNEWCYENEYRMISYNMKKDKIEAPEIKEIIFGINTTKEEVELVKKILCDKNEVLFKVVRDNKNDMINMKIENLEKNL